MTAAVAVYLATGALFSAFVAECNRRSGEDRLSTPVLLASLTLLGLTWPAWVLGAISMARKAGSARR